MHCFTRAAFAALTVLLTSCATAPKKSISVGSALSRIHSYYQREKTEGLPTQTIDKATPDEYRRWAIGLSGMLTAINLQNGIYDATQEHDDTIPYATTQSIEKERADLQKSWGVVDKNTLIQSISWCLVTGHSGEYVQIQQAIDQSILPSGVVAKVHKEHPGIDKNRIHQAYYYSKYTGKRLLHAFDYGRAVWLVRTGVTCGYLTEDEAAQWIQYTADKILGEYRSWEDFGINYCLGRLYWGGTKLTKKSFAALDLQLSDETLWKGRPWINKATITVPKSSISAGSATSPAATK
ncbi:MAG: DUF1266 domain-containing protein [Treponema sp.]|nr:DUF1266 domain-containing protein [Treponema sp.]